MQRFSGHGAGFLGSEPGETWAKSGLVRVRVQGGAKRDLRMANVPTLWEKLIDKNKSSRALSTSAKFLLISDDMGRPLFGPPVRRAIDRKRYATLSPKR